MAMNNYLQQIEKAVQATILHSPTTYSWFGKWSQPLPRAVQRVLTPQTARSYLHFHLQYQLYRNFYCQGFAAVVQTENAHPLDKPPLTAHHASFVAALSAANSGNGYSEDGWEVRSLQHQHIVLHKEDRLELLARREDITFPPEKPLTAGLRVSLRFPKEFLSMSPGFYMALSDKPFAMDDSKRLVRMYWHLTPDGAVHFMRNATSMFNRAHVPFKLKVLNSPDHYTRCDAAVLYIHKNDYERAVEIVGKIYLEVHPYLKDGVPALTKPLAAGVGLAEDPGRGESFGLHRCGLLADGIIRAWEQKKKLTDERMDIVLERFAEDGIDVERPYLNSGSRDIYPFQHLFHSRAPQSHLLKTIRHSDIDKEAFMRTSDDIGRRLSEEAVWHQDRCTWLGIAPGISNATGSPTGMVYRTLGPDLYDGVSGIALFLAELYAETGDHQVRRTALGAMRQGLAHVDTVSPSYRLGFYSGWIGIAFTAARVGILLDEDEFLDQAARLIERLAHDAQDSHEFDVLSGNAGTIAALVILQEIFEDTALLDFAVRLGDELLRAAETSESGYSWKSAAVPTARNLTGFAHGAAGVGYALFELFHATGDSQYRRAAELAFAYERQWFDADTGNWPDFREAPGRSKRGPLPSATHWCHGAPGIALSRLRAYEMLKDRTCEEEGIIGLRTTRVMIETWLHSEARNYSLCHGLAGNAEVLYYGWRVLGQESMKDMALVRQVANVGIERYALTGQTWPCGVDKGETPSLMLGLAGIGYFYLRMQNPSHPSVLLLRREEFCHE